MPAVKPDFFLVTSLLSTGSEADAPDAEHLRMQGHLALVRPLVDEQQGVVLREGGDRVLARFPDPVRATLCAVRIQQAHRSRQQGPAPPRIRVIVFAAEGTFDGTAEMALTWSRTWIQATGAGEIVLSAGVAAAWREDGNREMTPRGIVTTDGPADGFLLLWESHSHEPARTVRRRGWLFVSLIALPSLLLLLYSWLNLPQGNPQLTGDTLLWGPFWRDARPLGCPAVAMSRWQVIPDPRFTMSGLPRDASSRMVRATGHIETHENVRWAVMDLTDAMSGRHLWRASGPCEAEPCACFVRLTEARIGETPTAPDPFVLEVCAKLFEQGIPDARLREAAVARCQTASSVFSPAAPTDTGDAP
ncbi:hypothetical protein KKD52_12995 [Myxococcota bacterium]|nr:hypothetical protein [Myxococcota bacterium]MBU1511270.1 hypothetical protein [Myxococcota bacterium]